MPICFQYVSNYYLLTIIFIEIKLSLPDVSKHEIDRS